MKGYNLFHASNVDKEENRLPSAGKRGNKNRIILAMTFLKQSFFSHSEVKSTALLSGKKKKTQDCL